MYLVKRLSQQEAMPYMGSPNVLRFRKAQGSNININIAARPPQGDGPRGQNMMEVGGTAHPLVSPDTESPGRQALMAELRGLRQQRDAARAAHGMPPAVSPTGESPWRRTIERHAASNLNPNVVQRNLFSGTERRRNNAITNRNEIRARTIARIRNDGNIRQRFITESNRVRKNKRMKSYKEWLQFTRRNRRDPEIDFSRLRISKRKTPLWEINRLTNRFKRMKY